jgi:hypothetical protein
MSKSDEQEVGLRFTTSVEHELTVSGLYEQAGFVPMIVDRSVHGRVVFVFSKMSDAEMYRLIKTVPHQYSLLRGRVMGNSEPFRSPS